MTNTPHDAIDALRILASAFDQLGVRYYIGGSLASSAHGLPRSTMDAHILAALTVDHADALTSLLGQDFYYEPAAARDAIRRRQCFNIIHLPKMLKIDIFPTADAYDRNCLDRVVPRRLDESDPTSAFPLASPEDVILRKLIWFRSGGGVSERQWLDVQNVLKVQKDRLDDAYLNQWAADLDLSPLLKKARLEAYDKSP